MKELTVQKNDAGQRLDRFVGKAVPLLPESLLQKYIRLKRIKLNGKGARRDTRLSEGDVLSLYINDEFFEKPREENSYLRVGTPKLDIVYEDENILLADKKPGVLCHSAGAWDYNTLIAHIQAYLYQKGEWRPREENAFAPALCNRIDRNTGGIVIAAKNAEALRVMNEKIAAREIEKYYLCVVCGRPKPPEGALEGFIFKDAAKNRVYVRQKPEPGARTAVTYYRTLASRGGLSPGGVPPRHGPHAPDTRADGRGGHAAARRRQIRRRAGATAPWRERPAALLLPPRLRLPDGRRRAELPPRPLLQGRRKWTSPINISRTRNFD